MCIIGGAVAGWLLGWKNCETELFGALKAKTRRWSCSEVKWNDSKCVVMWSDQARKKTLAGIFWMDGKAVACDVSSLEPRCGHP